MKKTYRIDSCFYFLLIVFYKALMNGQKEAVFSNMKNLMDSYRKSSSIRNFGDGYDFLSEKKIDALLKKVSSAVFRKQNDFYYANLYDVFCMIESYGFAKSMVSGSAFTNILNEALEKHSFSGRDFAKYTEGRNFELIYLKREKRNIGFYLKHMEKKERK